MHPDTDKRVNRVGRARLRLFALGTVNVTLGGALIAACAPVIGLDSLEQVDCIGACDDGGTEAAMEPVIVLPDAGHVATDAGSPDSGTHDDSDGSPSSNENDAGDASNNSSLDAGGDAADGSDGSDGSAACGVSCDSATSLSNTCSANTCSYVCKPGRADCNQGTAGADLDGCECATTTCCGSSCQAVHNNGLGQTYADCTPAGTYNQTTATDACIAMTGSALSCSAKTCSGGASSICSSGSLTTCACWSYSGATAGRVAYTSGLLACTCPTTTSPTWD